MDWTSYITAGLSNAHAAVTAVALAAVCLLQYLLFLSKSRTARASRQQIAAQLVDAATRLSTLEEERALVMVESTFLRRLAQAKTVDEAAIALLEFCVPEANQGFAVYFDRSAGTPRIAGCRGLSHESRRHLVLDAAWPALVVRGSIVQLPGMEARCSDLYASLSAADQESVSRLYLLPVGENVGAGLIVTSELGIAGISADARHSLAERLLATLNSVVDRTRSLAVQNEELRLTRELLELRCLVETHHGSPLELLEEYLQRVATAANFDRATLFLASGDKLDNRPLVCVGAPLSRGIADLWRLDEAALVRRGMHATGLVSYRAADLHALRIRSTMCGAIVTPLTHSDGTIGVVCLARRVDQPVTSIECELVRRASDYLRETILRTVDRAMVEQQASRDALTGLANRHLFDREIARHVEQSFRSNTMCSLIMIDLDRFKALNDRFGHLAGDEVLRRTARVVQSCAARTRSSDRPLVARYGGEEIAVLMPGVPIEGARRIGQEILDELRTTEIVFEGRSLMITGSAGAATSPAHGTTPEELIAAADAALYQAKHNGRDRLESADRDTSATIPIAAFAS